MIFNMTSGGGAGGAALNFKVVGGAVEPSNPKENTIWVNTDVPIPEWMFSAEQPDFALDSSVYGITSDENKTLYTLSGRNYIKVNAGKAIYTLTALTGSYWSPILVSPDPDAVATTTSYASSEIRTYQGTVEYEGVTYYYCRANYGYEGTFSVTPKYTDSIEIEALALLMAEEYHKLEENSGTVWFNVGTSSPVEFNALKKNGIHVYPLSANQYIDGALVDVEAKIYQNGEWVEWIVILVDDSYLSNRYGEWMATNYGGTGGTVIYTENGISVKANAGDNTKYGGGMFAGPSETINFDDINEIHFIIANNTSYSITAQLLITSVKDTAYNSSTVATGGAAIASGSEAEVLFDTSAVTGNYYLRFGCSTSKTTTSSRTLVFRKIFWGLA